MMNRNGAGKFAALLACTAFFGFSQVAQADDPGIDSTAKTILIGAGTSFSGPQSFYAQVNMGAKARFQLANDTDELKGWKINYKLVDDSYIPTRNLANMKKLVEQDKVFAIVVNQGTPTNVAASKYLSTVPEVPVVGPTEGYPPLAKFPNYFVLMPNYSWEAGLETQYAVKKLGAKKVAVLYENDDLGTPAKEGTTAVLESMGMKPAALVPFSADAVDFTGPVSTLAKAQADAVIVYGGNGNIASALKAANSLGFEPHWFGPFWGADPSTYRLAGPLVDGMYFSSWFKPLTDDDASTNAFVDAMKKYSPKTPIGGLAANGWSEASLFVEGVKTLIDEGKPISRVNLMDALNHFQDKDIGMVQHVTFTKEDHDIGLTQEVLVQAKGGKYYSVTPSMKFPDAALHLTDSKRK